MTRAAHEMKMIHPLSKLDYICEDVSRLWHYMC